MPMRSGILSFGLVAIPVKVYSATKDQTVRFNLLHKKCGSRSYYLGLDKGGEKPYRLLATALEQAKKLPSPSS